MKSTTTELAPDIFRITTFFPDFNLQFSQFLVRDDEPLLFHTGMRALFGVVKDAVAEILDPASIRWIGFSHFEADECGSLNEWLAVAPRAEAACTFVGAMVSVNDFASRPARALQHEEVFTTGKHRFRFLATPQVPHAWDAGLLFEEGNAALFCSDLLHQSGDVEAITDADIASRFRETIIEYQAGPLANYLPYTPRTQPTLESLAALKPRLLLPMHGSAFSGDGSRVLLDVAEVLRDTLGA